MSTDDKDIADREPNPPSWLIDQKKKEEEMAMAQTRQNLGITNPEDIFDKNEPAQDQGAKEPNVDHNTSTMSVESLFGGAPQKVQEEPVIDGLANTGLNFMVLDTTLLAYKKIKPGAEICLLIAQAVQRGTPLFGKYPAQKGNTIISVDAARWAGKFENLPVVEKPTGLMVSAPQILGGKSPAAFIDEQTTKNPDAKLLIIDNLADFLPTWGNVGNTTEALMSDLNALHDACAKHRIALGAILDIAEESQKNLWDSYKAIQTEMCLPVIRIKGEYVSNVTPEVKVSGKGFNSHLEFVDGKWTEKVENEKSTTVLDYTNQGKVLAAVKDMQGEFTAANVTVTGLNLSQVSSALSSLATKGMLERTRQKHFRMNSNK